MAEKITDLISGSLPLSGGELIEIVQGVNSRSAPVSGIGHNTLSELQGGITSAGEYYHLSQSIHDGLFSASPTIGLGAPSATRLEVDYGNQEITAYHNTLQFLKIEDSPEGDTTMILGDDVSGTLMEISTDSDPGPFIEATVENQQTFKVRENSQFLGTSSANLSLAKSTELAVLSANSRGGLTLDGVAATTLLKSIATASEERVARILISDQYNLDIYGGRSDAASELIGHFDNDVQTVGVSGTGEYLKIDQTNNTVTIEVSGSEVGEFNSSGFTVTGTTDISGHTAVGNTASVHTAIALRIGEDFNDTGATYGQFIAAENLGVNAGAAVTGIYSSCHNSTSTLYDSIKGGVFVANESSNNVVATSMLGVDALVVTSSDNSTITNMIGGNFEVATGFSMSGAVITNMVGGQFQILESGSGDVSVTDGYGLLVETPGYTSSGTTTNLYGLYIEDQSTVGFVNDYNLYSAGVSSENKFEGNVTIDGNLTVSGTSTPDTSASSTYMYYVSPSGAISTTSRMTFDVSQGDIIFYGDVGAGAQPMIHYDESSAFLKLGDQTHTYIYLREMDDSGQGSLRLFAGDDIQLRPTNELTIDVGGGVDEVIVDTNGLHYLNISTVTAQTTASNADVILASAGAAPFTVYLQNDAFTDEIKVKKIDSGSTVTVEGLVGTIDGAANATLTSQYESKTFVWDGTNWFIV